MRAVAVLIAVAFAGLVSQSLGDQPSGACVGRRLPAPITIAAPIATTAGHYVGAIGYRIGCNEKIHRLGRMRSSFTEGTAFGSTPGVWWGLRGGHLVIGRHRTLVWRSHRRFRSLFTVFAVQVGNRTVAFSYGDSLYLAPVRGVERLVGRQEYPLGFTRGGIYTISWLRGLLLRSDTGAILKTIMHWTRQYLVARERLYFIAHGVLMSGRGARLRRLTSLRKLGMSADVGLQPLSADPWAQLPSRLLELEDNNRLTVLRADGSVFATASSREWGGGGISNSPVVDPGGNAVAFTATSGQANATETVYILRPGARQAEALHRERVHLGVCTGVGTSLQWHGSWLLYSDTNGHLAALDTAGQHRVVELTAVLRSLRVANPGVTAYWAGQPPRF